MSPTPDWLQAPGVQRRGSRAVTAITLIAAAAASAAGLALWDGPPRPLPAAPIPPAARAQPPPAPERREEPGPTLAPAPAMVRPAARTRARIQTARRGPRNLLLPLALGPGASAGWIRRGNRLASRGQFRAALAAYQSAVGLNPHSADAWYGVSLCDYELFRDDPAAHALTQALFEDPSHAMANLLSGFMSQERGDPSAARRFYDRYLAREPDGAYAEDVVSVLEQLPDEE